MPRRQTTLLIAALLIPIGIAWRMAPLHLSPFLWKYGGSILWAAMVYWIVAAILPKRPPLEIAILSTFIAAFVELTRLYHFPALDAFRLTGAGKLLLGRIFSPRDILAYTLAIVAAAALDHYLPSPEPSNKLN